MKAWSPAPFSSFNCDNIHNREKYSLFQTFAVFWMLYSYYWVIPRRLNFTCRRFGIIRLFHLHRWTGWFVLLTPPMKKEECSETSAHKIQTPGNHPRKNTTEKNTSRKLLTKIDTHSMPKNLISSEVIQRTRASATVYTYFLTSMINKELWST
jgi:hypothetical protein